MTRRPPCPSCLQKEMRSVHTGELSFEMHITHARKAHRCDMKQQYVTPLFHFGVWTSFDMQIWINMHSKEEPEDTHSQRLGLDNI